MFYLQYEKNWECTRSIDSLAGKHYKSWTKHWILHSELDSGICMHLCNSYENFLSDLEIDKKNSMEVVCTIVYYILNKKCYIWNQIQLNHNELGDYILLFVFNRIFFFHLFGLNQKMVIKIMWIECNICIQFKMISIFRFEW